MIKERIEVTSNLRLEEEEDGDRIYDSEGSESISEAQTTRDIQEG
jgi:hypothetical protein